MKTLGSILIFILVHIVALGQDSGGEESPDEVMSEQNAESVHEPIDPARLETTAEYQSEEVTLRSLDDEKWKKIVGETNYVEEPIGARDLPKISLPWAGPVLKVIGYAVVISLAVYLIYYLARNLTFGSRVERTQLRTEDVGQPVEDIEELDIDALLEQARREGNLRMAVRLYYLGLLKKLNAVGKIVWKKDKTNRDYLSELLSGNFYFSEVQRLTRSYEAVWYGEHDLERDSFERIRENFESIYRLIKNSDTA